MRHKEPWKPMLAGTIDPEKLVFPVYASPKLDGVRSIGAGDKMWTRSGLPVPNALIQKSFGIKEMSGLDGEFIVGQSSGEGVLSRTQSVVMSLSGSIVDLTYHVFDFLPQHDARSWSFSHRYDRAHEAVERLRDLGLPVRLVRQAVIEDIEGLEFIDRKHIEQGYEGTMVRGMSSPYKHGRSTTKEGYLLKMKQFEDAEGRVTGFKELEHNANELLASGRRATKKEGKTAGNTLGAFSVRATINGKTVEFDVGSGFTADQRSLFWQRREILVGKILKFKYFRFDDGGLPRWPVFICFRSELDL